MSSPIAGKVLLTGASGFIGGRLRDVLLKDGVDVVSIRRRGSPPSDLGRTAELDYEDRAGLERLMREEKPDYVLHVAGVTKGVTYEDFQRGNVMPTQHLLGALRSAHPGVQRFVLISSLASHGPSREDAPITESSPACPVEYYGESKLEAERIVASECGEVPWTILRPSGVYGPGDVDYFNLFREVARGRNLFFGNRHRWFSAVYVDDLIAAILSASAHEKTRKQGYFVCDGVPVTWERFQSAVVAASGRRVLTLNLPEALVTAAAIGGELATRLDGKPRLFNRQKAKMGAQSAWTCSSSALRADTGWASTIDVDEGTRRAFAWYKAEGWL